MIRIALALASFCSLGMLGAQAGLAAPPAEGEGSLPVPASIRTRHVPPIAAAEVAGLRPYANIRSASFADWHPRQRRLLISTRFGDTDQLHEVALPLGARRQLTFFAERVREGEYRPGRPQQIAYLRDTGGDENYQLYLFDRDRGEHRLLSDGVHRHTGARFSPDGRWLAFTGNARNGRDMDLYLVSPEDAQRRRIADLEGSWTTQAWAPDAGRLLIRRYRSINEAELELVEVPSGERRSLTAGSAPASYRGAAFSPDGQTLYLLTDRDAEMVRIMRLDLASGAWEVVAGDEWPVSSFDLSEDGAQIAYLTNADGISQLHLIETASGRQLPAPALPPGIAGDLAHRPGSREVALSLSWAQAPSDVYSYDPGSPGSGLVRWTESETGGLDPERFAVPELVRFPTFDRVGENGRSGAQRTIPAFVYRPPEERFSPPYPVYVSIHGGPEGQSRPRFLGAENFLVNELGIALVYPNVRGSTGYGKTYRNLDNGFGREDSVRDIGALLDWIAGRDDLDASRVMVGGGSYGGYMVLASLVHYGDRLRGGYEAVGISNFVTFLTNTQAYRRDLRRAEYGDERDPEMRAFLERIAPANRVERITVPLLVAQGANDPRVPLSESDQIVAALEGRGTPVWYLVAENEGHGFRKKANRDYLNAVRIRFIQEVLLGSKSEPGG